MTEIVAERYIQACDTLYPDIMPTCRRLPLKATEIGT